MKYKTELLFLLLILCLCYIGCEWTKPVKTEIVHVPGPVQHFRDTLKVRDSFPYPVPYLVWKAPKDSITPKSAQLVLCDSVRNYLSTIKDSSGTVIVETKVQGVMLNQTIDLQLFKDSMVQHDTTFIYITTTKQQKLFMPFIAIENSPTPLKGGVIFGNDRIKYGGYYGGKQNVGVIFGLNLSKK